MNIIHPESLSFWTLIVFVCLLLLLRAFAWKPILKALKDRETSINNALEAADKAKAEMANLQADNEKLLAEARQEREAILKEAREIKERIVSQAKDEALEASEKLLAHAKASIESEKQTADRQHFSGYCQESAYQGTRLRGETRETRRKFVERN